MAVITRERTPNSKEHKDPNEDKRSASNQPNIYYCLKRLDRAATAPGCHQRCSGICPASPCDALGTNYVFI